MTAQQSRERALLSIEQAAQAAGVTAGYLRQIERFGRNCSFPLAQRLARLYGCSINVFVSGRRAGKKGLVSEIEGKNEPSLGKGGQKTGKQSKNTLNVAR